MKLVRPQKISDQVLSVLEGRIVEGVYAEGGKIPPERVLAEEFGVSRPSVRSALNILVARQILEARQGDGYYVSVKPQQDFCKVGRSFWANIPIGNRMFLISAATSRAVWRHWRQNAGRMPI
ncbi:GntR family transcriptional regulator [Neisseria gonorrhoeae]|uniref:GntR family transcriptional regulator n=1 Tax=Neisseria gonorrhoeae TaxID=485 RepID=A0A378VU43_NEIGO|nr:GntR family transcriptional regulator [Neisseria gonorrhoeae]